MWNAWYLHNTSWVLQLVNKTTIVFFTKIVTTSSC
jgi:hypothetical protein